MVLTLKRLMSLFLVLVLVFSFSSYASAAAVALPYSKEYEITKDITETAIYEVNFVDKVVTGEYAAVHASEAAASRSVTSILKGNLLKNIGISVGSAITAALGSLAAYFLASSDSSNPYDLPELDPSPLVDVAESSKASGKAEPVPKASVDAIKSAFKKMAIQDGLSGSLSFDVSKTLPASGTYLTPFIRLGDIKIEEVEGIPAWGLFIRPYGDLSVYTSAASGRLAFFYTSRGNIKNSFNLDTTTGIDWFFRFYVDSVTDNPSRNYQYYRPGLAVYPSKLDEDTGNRVPDLTREVKYRYVLPSIHINNSVGRTSPDYPSYPSEFTAIDGSDIQEPQTVAIPYDPAALSDDYDWSTSVDVPDDFEGIDEADPDDLAPAPEPTPDDEPYPFPYPDPFPDGVTPTPENPDSSVTQPEGSTSWVFNIPILGTILTALRNVWRILYQTGINVANFFNRFFSGLASVFTNLFQNLITALGDLPVINTIRDTGIEISSKLSEVISLLEGLDLSGFVDSFAGLFLVVFSYLSLIGEVFPVPWMVSIFVSAMILVLLIKFVYPFD